MSGSARVESVDALAAFRTMLVKFAEAANTALADAESEAQRVLVWLETEQDTYWQGQIRKRHDDVERCKDAVRQKRLYKSPTGSTQSVVEEEKALRVAVRRLEEAEQKLRNVRRWIPRLQKEISVFKGGVQRLTTTVLADIPVALSRLNKMIAALKQYAALSITAGGVMEGMEEAAQTMARAAAELTVRADYSAQRAKTGAVDRAQAVAGSVRLEKWSDGLVSDREREILNKLDADRKPVDPQQTVLIEETAWQSARIYLERTAAAADVTDTGWFLGRADGIEGTRHLKVSVAELLEVRPDLADVLALPAGWLLVIDLGGVAAVLDEKGSDVWAAATTTPASTAASAGTQATPQ